MKSLPMPTCSSVCPILSYSTFTVSDLILRSLSHFEWIIVQGERLGSSFSSVQVDIQFSQHSLLESLSFFQRTLGLICQKSNGCSCMGLSIVFHWSLCLILYGYHAVFILWFCSIFLKTGIMIIHVVLFA
jgi:hypothetical protein